jgi:hypothetical protein
MTAFGTEAAIAYVTGSRDALSACCPRTLAQHNAVGRKFAVSQIPVTRSSLLYKQHARGEHRL